MRTLIGAAKSRWRIRPQTALLLPALLLCGEPLGCVKGAVSPSGVSSSGSSGSSAAAGNHVNMTGNWGFTATATQGPLPFSTLSGFVYEDYDNQATDYGTGSLLPTSTGCFANAGTVPMQGGVTGGELQVSSFEVNGQILSIGGSEDSSGASFTGTYSVQGGCGNGDNGTLAGVRYSPLTGSYAGMLNGASSQQVQLMLTQFAGGTGSADFLVSGTASFTGFGCFSQGTLPANGAGSVSGGSASLTFATNDPGGAQLQLLGTFDPSATTISLSSVQIIGGSCPGFVGTASLFQS